MGEKEYYIDNVVYIEKRDYQEKLRLKHAFNLENGKFAGFDKKDYPIIHWVNHEYVEGEVLMPNGDIVRGYFEYYITELKEGEIIQMERFGFGRIEKNEGCYVRIRFTHN